MARELITMACTECKSRNYTSTRNKKAQGSERLDTEEEGVRETAGPGIGDAAGISQVKQGEGQIDGDEGGGEFQEEPWPGDREHLGVDVHEAAAVLTLHHRQALAARQLGKAADLGRQMPDAWRLSYEAM